MLQTNLVNQIYDLIVKKIISSELKMGNKINMSSIAEEFKVSVTPIREALNKLTKVGLVKNIPNVGNFVVEINQKDIEEILYIRELIENNSLKYALMEDNIATFKKLLTYSEELKNEKDKNKIREIFYHLDTNIHLSIVKSTSNKWLIEMYERIFNVLFVFILKVHHSDEFYGQHFDHCIKLLEAIIGNNYIEAKKALGIHFDHTRENFNNYFNAE